MCPIKINQFRLPGWEGGMARPFGALTQIETGEPETHWFQASALKQARNVSTSNKPSNPAALLLWQGFGGFDPTGIFPCARDILVGVGGGFKVEGAWPLHSLLAEPQAIRLHNGG